VTTKTAYQRPYKSRNQRREADRRKTDDVTNRRFLYKAFGGVALLVVLALAFAFEGLADRDSATPQYRAAVLK